MSADAWGICPKCGKAAAENQPNAAKIAQEAYGKVPPEEYARLAKAAEQQEDADPPMTLREDYSIWTDEDGVFSVSYRCGCTACGFSHEFEHKEKFKA